MPTFPDGWPFYLLISDRCCCHDIAFFVVVYTLCTHMHTHTHTTHATHTCTLHNTRMFAYAQTLGSTLIPHIANHNLAVSLFPPSLSSLSFSFYFNFVPMHHQSPLTQLMHSIHTITSVSYLLHPPFLFSLLSPSPPFSYTIPRLSPSLLTYNSPLIIVKRWTAAPQCVVWPCESAVCVVSACATRPSQDTTLPPTHQTRQTRLTCVKCLNLIYPLEESENRLGEISWGGPSGDFLC